MLGYWGQQAEIRGQGSPAAGIPCEGLGYQQRDWKRGNWQPLEAVPVKHKERYPLKEDLVNCRGKWTTAYSGIQYLREFAVQR